MVPFGRARGPPLIVAGRADSHVGYLDHFDHFIAGLVGVRLAGLARIPNTHRPGGAIGPTACEIEIAARIDRKIPQGLQFVRSHIDRETLRHGAEIENQRTREGNGLAFWIEVDVPKADRAIGIDPRLDDLTRPVLAVEPARLHHMADRRIEGAAALFRHRQRKLHRLIERRAHRNGHTDPCRELHQFASRLESGAARFDLMKPVERGVQACSGVTRDLNGDRRVHEHFGADVVVLSHDGL